MPENERGPDEDKGGAAEKRWMVPHAAERSVARAGRQVGWPLACQWSTKSKRPSSAVPRDVCAGGATAGADIDIAKATAHAYWHLADDVGVDAIGEEVRVVALVHP